jgi:hypothetical protein
MGLANTPVPGAGSPPPTTAIAAPATAPPKPINTMPAPSAIKCLRIALYLTFAQNPFG